MTKKEKYYDYIINDLMSETHVQGDWVHGHKTFFPFSPYVYFAFGIPEAYYDGFSMYIVSKFGVNSKEIALLWDKYRKTIKMFFNE